MYGPYVHALNKGGLDDIIKFQRLISTEGRYGDIAVRAVVGSFREYYEFMGLGINPEQSEDEIFIEFLTVHKPAADTPPRLALWRMPEGHYLAVQITGVFKGREKIVVGRPVESESL